MASKRRTAVDQLVVILAAVAPAGGFVNDLTGGGASSIAQETMQSRRDSGLPVVVRVRDGEEYIERGSLTGGIMDSRLVMFVEVYRKAEGDAAIVDQMNDLIADIRLSVDKNTTLNGSVIDAFVTYVEAPAYDFDQKDAICTMQVTAVYSVTQGTEI